MCQYVYKNDFTKKLCLSLKFLTLKVKNQFYQVEFYFKLFSFKYTFYDS